jgi:hypothetical protein
MQIPVYGDQQVGVSTLPTPQQPKVDQAAKAVVDLGSAIGDTGAHIFDFAAHQYQKAIETMVTDSKTKLLSSTLAIENNHYNKKGKDALDVTPAMDYYKKVDSEIYNSIPNAEAKRQYKLHTSLNQVKFETNIHNHTARELDIYNKESAAGLADVEFQRLANFKDNPSEFDLNNPKSQINAYRAAEANVLAQHGIDGSLDNLDAGNPAFKAGINKATSKALEFYIHHLADTSPSSANEKLKEVRGLLEPATLLRLEDRVKSVNDKTVALSEAMTLSKEMGPEKLLADDVDGSKYHGNVKLAPFDIQGMMKKVREKYADKPDVVTHVEATLNKMKAEHYEAAREQRETNTDYVYGQLASGASPSSVYASRQYQELPGKDKKSVQDYVRAQQREVEHETYKRKSEAEIARAKLRQQQQEAYEVLISTLSPDDILKMSKADIQHKAGEIGTTRVAQLLALKGRYEKDEHALSTAKVEETGLKEVMVEAGYDWAFNSTKSAEEKRIYGKVLSDVTDVIREEGMVTGKAVTPERKKEIYRERLLKVHVMKNSFLSRFTGSGTTEVERPMFDTDPYNIVVDGASSEDVAMAASVLASKGIKHPSPSMLKRAVQELKR